MAKGFSPRLYNTTTVAPPAWSTEAAREGGRLRSLRPALPRAKRESPECAANTTAIVWAVCSQCVVSCPPPHMTENLVHPPVLQSRAISRNLRLFWDALGVICGLCLGTLGSCWRGRAGRQWRPTRAIASKFGEISKFENAERRGRALIAWVIAKPPQVYHSVSETHTLTRQTQSVQYT